jgi:hypothetical protein
LKRRPFAVRTHVLAGVTPAVVNFRAQRDRSLVHASASGERKCAAWPFFDHLSATMSEYTDLHELAKGWKAAITRATDPSTK